MKEDRGREGRERERDDREDRPSKRSRRERSPGGGRHHRSRSRSKSRSRSPSPVANRGGTQSPPRKPDPLHAMELAKAKAAEISKQLQNKEKPKVTMTSSGKLIQQDPRENALKEARAREIQTSIAVQLASVTSMLENVKRQQGRSADYRPLILDASGREIDEKGNVVKKTEQFKTLAANVAVGQAQKKKENPYLSHRTGSAKPVDSIAETVVTPATTPTTTPLVVHDERIKTSSRELRAKKSFNFIEAGTFVKNADQQRFKEERKIIAGYSSGRRAPEIAGEESDLPSTTTHDGERNEEGRELASDNAALKIFVPPPPDNGVVPCMEWWDEAFLPKPMREARKRSRAKQEVDDFEYLAFGNCNTIKLIQHPIPVKPIGGDRQDEPLKLFLTKKERKRIRRTAREEREREKRDKMLMGLIPTPEPKFKLSNFMKILGDQAVADPSKVEKRVIQQMQQRRLNHEMRNLANKLTPSERKEKKRRKLTEDTSRQVHVAIFRVKDFSDPKHRFKVDVNIQQLNLSGTAVLCPAGETNLIVVEGGPKGIKKIIKLMTKRVLWTKRSENIAKRGGLRSDVGYYGEALPPGHIPETIPEGNEEDEANGEREVNKGGKGEDGTGEAVENGDEEDDDASDDNDDEHDDQAAATGDGTTGTKGDDHDEDNTMLNSCDLLWQGIVPRRLFHGFRFQECRTISSARKVLEAKGIAHYWDMVLRADSLISAENS